MQQAEKETGKKKYCRPALRKISLATDEVLAVGCKTIGGRNWPTQAHCGIAAKCSASGS